jgi:hypothetical protein
MIGGHVYMEEIKEIYFPLVVEINPERREYIEWAERNEAGLPFTIELGPKSLRKAKLEQGLIGNRLEEDVLELLENEGVDGLLNLRFYALGARNFCEMELINIPQTIQADRNIRGYRYTFGLEDVFGKNAELEHKANLAELPRWNGSMLLRLANQLISDRQVHTPSLHINARLMYQYGLNYLLSDYVDHQKIATDF